MPPAPATATTTFSRAFHAGAHARSVSPLFHLQGLSNSRETQWLSRTSGLPRVEHSPSLQLLRAEADVVHQKQKSKPKATRGADAQLWIRTDAEQVEKALRLALAEERARHERELEIWAVVKARMNSHKEKAETVGALFMVISALLGAALYYQHRHSSAIQARLDDNALDVAKAPEHVVRVDSTPLTPPEPSMPVPVPVPPPVAATNEPRRSGRNLFWQY